MARYSTDFSEYANTAALVAEWTQRWHTSFAYVTLESDAEAFGGKVLKFDTLSQSDNRHAVSWNRIDADPDRAELDILFRIKSGGTGSGQAGALGRGSGDTTSETGYVGQPDKANNNFRIARYSNANAAILANGGSFSNNIWHWVRVRYFGDQLKLRAWQGTTADEPATWNIEQTNTVVSAAGWVGLMTFNSSANFCDFFSVGTGGDIADSPVSEVPKLFWVYYPSDQADPGAGAIITGTVPNGIHGNDPAPEGSIDPFTGTAITGLTPSASYKLASVWYNGADSSNAVISDAFVTDSVGGATAPVLSLINASSITGTSIIPQVTVTFS